MDESAVWGISHFSPSVTMLFCTILPPTSSNCGVSKGVWSSRSLVPGDAGPLVTRFAAVLSGTVAIHAVDLDRRPRLGVQAAVAVVVLLEVAVHAVHPLLEVDVLQVDGFLELLRVVVLDDAALRIEQVALAVALEHGAEDPSVAVEVGELGGLELGVQRSDVVEELGIGPEPPERGPLGVLALDGVPLGGGELALPRRVHHLPVGLVVPPGVAEVGRDHVGPRVHVAGHALARRDRTGEDVLDGMPGLVLRDGRVDAPAQPAVAELVARVGPGIGPGAVVRVDDVAGGAAAGAVVSGVVVGSRQREHRVHEARLLGADDHGIGPVQRPDAPGREPLVGLAGLLEGIRKGDLELPPASALEDTEAIAGLRQLPAGEGEKERHLALVAHRLRRRLGNGLQHARLAVGSVALAHHRRLQGEHAVVVEGGLVEEGPVGHHALGNVVHDRIVVLVVARAAGQGGRTQVRRVHEAHVGQVLLEPRGVRILGIGAGAEDLGILRQDMGAVPGLLVALRPGGPRDPDRGVAAMAVGAAEDDGLGLMHRLGVGVGVAADAPGALSRGVFPGLANRRRARHGGHGRRRRVGAAGARRSREGEGECRRAHQRPRDHRPPRSLHLCHRRLRLPPSTSVSGSRTR